MNTDGLAWPPTAAVQLVAAADHDAALLAVAAWCERVLDFTLTPSQ
jgi:hypothetical protein